MGWLSRFPARIRRPERNGGALLTLALSFNNDGPLGTFFRYIGDTGTYIARYDELVDGRDQAIDVSQVDVSMNSIEFQDREFIAAVREGRELNGSVRQVMSCYGWAAPARTATLYGHCLRGGGGWLLFSLRLTVSDGRNRT